MKLIKKFSNGSNIYYADVKQKYLLETVTGNFLFETLEAAINAHNSSELIVDAASDVIILRPARGIFN